jgi:hypothetical protein
MSDYQDYSLYGDTDNASLIPANMMNSNAMGPNDWNTVLTQGITGAAVSAINGMVGAAYASGQLKPMPVSATVGGRRISGTSLLVIGAIALLLLKG